MIPSFAGYLLIIPFQSDMLVALYVGLVIATVGLAYYAAMIFFHMRNGRLEKGWKLVVVGIICLCISFLFFTFQHVVSRISVLYFYLDTLGTILAIAGIVLMFFGLRFHYHVWTRKGQFSGPSAVTSIARN